MKKETIEFSYLHPVVKVAEIKARQVLCQSPEFGSINDMSRDEEEGI